MATKKVKETDYLTDEALQAKDLYTRYSNLYDNYTREENKYKDQTESLGQQLINYKPFTYDINSDVMYRQYKDQYQKLGQQAMADTMGQAAALTGGYGNSYAATVGNQAYQSYLQQLYDRIPELYNMALNNYNTNRSNLESALATASQLYNMEENRTGKRLPGNKTTEKKQQYFLFCCLSRRTIFKTSSILLLGSSNIVWYILRFSLAVR